MGVRLRCGRDGAGRRLVASAEPAQRHGLDAEHAEQDRVEGAERLQWLSAAGDPLERLAAVVDFELFRPELDAALGRSDRTKGGRPPYDAVMMFRVLVLQTLYTLPDDQTEYQLRDRLSFMRFAGLSDREWVDPLRPRFVKRPDVA